MSGYCHNMSSVNCLSLRKSDSSPICEDLETGVERRGLGIGTLNYLYRCGSKNLSSSSNLTLL